MENAGQDFFLRWNGVYFYGLFSRAKSMEELDVLMEIEKDVCSGDKTWEPVRDKMMAAYKYRKTMLEKV